MLYLIIQSSFSNIFIRLCTFRKSDSHKNIIYYMYLWKKNYTKEIVIYFNSKAKKMHYFCVTMAKYCDLLLIKFYMYIY